MGKRLVIAEKPMLAKAILDAIPGTAKSIKAGERVFYTEKGDYLVVALAGHVLQLKEPEDYDPKYKKWTLEDLPIFFPVPFPVSWTVKMKKKQKETQDILSYHSQAAGCSDKARAKASGGRQPIEECGRTGL